MSIGEGDLDIHETETLRAHLAAHNGIMGLELVGPTDLVRAVELFQRDGFVVITDVLNQARHRGTAVHCTSDQGHLSQAMEGLCI